MASNFNDTLPVAPAGGVNVKWQTDGAGNDSAYIPSGSFIPAGGGDFVKLGEVIVSSPQPTVAFSTIPGTYRNLKLIATGRTAGTADLYLQFNGDTGTNYDSILLYTAGVVASAGNQFGVAKASWGQLALSTAPANQAGSSEIIIYDYARTAWLKNITSHAVRMDTGASGFNILFSGTWHNTAAITDILAGTTDASNLEAGTVISLYGIN
jgi:hypothetical protein